MFTKVGVTRVFGRALDPLIDNLSIKGSVAQKQGPHQLLWTLWFDVKIYLMYFEWKKKYLYHSVYTWITPPPLEPFFVHKKSSGKLIIFPIQSKTIDSNSVHAGAAAYT